MTEENKFVEKMESIYAEKNSNAIKDINSIIFEYRCSINKLPAFGREINEIINSSQELNVAILMQRLNPALKIANDILLDISIMDEFVRDNYEMKKLLDALPLYFTIATAESFILKIISLKLYIIEKKNKSEDLKIENERMRVLQATKKNELERFEIEKRRKLELDENERRNKIIKKEINIK